VFPVTHGPLVEPDGTTTFRVWAPSAERVELVLDGGKVPLQEGAHGWFAARTQARHGGRYAYRLDGGPVRPDPASRWQPDGVHEPSAVFDTATLAWSPQEADWRPPPLSGAVVYELHIGTFTAGGTLDAAAERLGDLAALGVTHVELLPVNAFNGTRGWGYDGVCWFAVHEPYGGPAALARFVDAAHRHGLAVVVDAVYNHLGPSGNYLPDYGPYLTDRYRTPWGDCLNLDGPLSDPVRAFVIESALHWLTDLHADALRLDAVHGLIDNSSVHVLRELSAAVDARAEALRRPLVLLAESDRNDPLTVTPRELGGQGLDGQWVDDLHHAIHVAVTGEREGYYADYTGLPDVAAAYARGFVYDGRYSGYRRMRIGAPLGAVAGWRLVTCIQNHDQIGNRALGERLETLVEPALARVAVVLLCASPTTPMLFMGEEYGEPAPFQYFTSHPEPELAEAVRRGRREEFGAFAAFSSQEVPDPQDPRTFARSTLDHERAGSEAGRRRLALWTDLLALRRRLPALGVGRRELVEVLEATAERLVLVRGDAEGGRVLLAVNLAAHAAALVLPPVEGSWNVRLSTEDARYGGQGFDAVEEGRLRLPARSATLLLAVAEA
jgi:maltooligosyltrehalose trehalohydrolase